MTQAKSGLSLLQNLLVAPYVYAVILQPVYFSYGLTISNTVQIQKGQESKIVKELYRSPNKFSNNTCQSNKICYVGPSHHDRNNI
jgi:hypothetical protein